MKISHGMQSAAGPQCASMHGRVQQLFIRNLLCQAHDPRTSSYQHRAKEILMGTSMDPKRKSLSSHDEDTFCIQAYCDCRVALTKHPK